MSTTTISETPVPSIRTFDPRSWIVQRIVNRIKRHNLNAIIGFFGPPGKGKSTSSFDLSEQVSGRLGLPFTVDMIHFSVRDFLHQINEHPPRGTFDILDDAETDANSQKWWTEAAHAISLVGSSSRYLGYPYVVSAPDSEMLTGQFRRCFHLYFEVQRIDYDKKLVITKPQVPYRDYKSGKIRGKYPRAVIPGLGLVRVQEVAWHLPRHATGPFSTWVEYEERKADYMDALYQRLEDGLVSGRRTARPWHIKLLQLFRSEHPDWTQERLAQEIGITHQAVSNLLRQGT